MEVVDTVEPITKEIVTQVMVMEDIIIIIVMVENIIPTEILPFTIIAPKDTAIIKTAVVIDHIENKDIDIILLYFTFALRIIK